MRAKWINLFWGIILIAAGALFLAQNLGYLDQLELPVLMVVFTVVSLLFFATYFLNGLGNWGWLFPAFIFAALALVLWMQTRGIEGPWMGVPVLVAVALPFLVAFALSPRENWWALIPAWVMAVISAIVIFAEEAQGEWIGALVLFSIGFPFLVVYLADRQNWWALIPAWTLLVLSLIVLLSTQVQGEWIAVLVLLGIALPFFVVYFRNRDNWWALIPAGVLASSAVSVFLAGLFGEQGSLLAKPGVLHCRCIHRHHLPGHCRHLLRLVAAAREPAYRLGNLRCRCLGCCRPGLSALRRIPDRFPHLYHRRWHPDPLSCLSLAKNCLTQAVGSAQIL